MQQILLKSSSLVGFQNLHNIVVFLRESCFPRCSVNCEMMATCSRKPRRLITKLRAY